MSDDDKITLLPRHEITRRDALKLFGAALAVLETGCFERPGEEIRPTVRRPEDTPGPRRMFATSMVVDGYATGLLALSHTGRPIKLEGNPAHPASLGATTAQHQASIIELYDPHRVRAPRLDGTTMSWEAFRTALGSLPKGDVWLVVPPDGSPTRAALIDRVRQRFPQLHVVYYSPCDRSEAFRGAQLAFGAPLELQLALDRANVVVSLDADLFGTMPNSTRWAHDFAPRRRAVEPGEQPARVFVAEPMMTPTGSLADHRLALRAGDIAAAAVALADALERRGVAMPALPGDLRTAARARVDGHMGSWVELAATSLVRERGASVIVAGDRQPAAVHALVHRMALSLGAIGRTTSFTKPVFAAPLGEASLADLGAAIRGGSVGAVIALDCDPVYSAPQLELGVLLPRVPFTAHATMHANETSTACHWVVPLSHYLESWGDARAWDGTVSTIQPLISPLHDTRTVPQLLAHLAGTIAPTDDADPREMLRAQWKSKFPNDADWRAALAEGIVRGSGEPAVTVSPKGDGELASGLSRLFSAWEHAELEIDLAPSPKVLDGRYAENPWLQEMPHPVTKVVWTNVAMMSTATADDLGVGIGDIVRIERGDSAIELPAFPVAGHAERSITVELGYGQRNPESPISNRLGANGFLLGGNIVSGVTAKATGSSIGLPRTQRDFNRHDRETAFSTDLATYRKDAEMYEEHRAKDQPSLVPVPERSESIPQWAMTIDTTICTGCSSCVIACQAENNVPVVGADGVRRGREMHWLRIDTYIEDTPTGTEYVNQPMLCQHCEMAPCEYVCPVFATTHSPDGLNEMTYNRCIGTRFCSNNCPYKVRRFNFFAYDKPADMTALQRNPDVTVRARGVMEKCSLCVQRIRGAEVTARMEKRDVHSGEVKTACMQACPTGAIQFAALQHTDSEMVKRRKSKRLYGTLHELGTRPRVMYLAKIRNPEEGK